MKLTTCIQKILIHTNPYWPFSHLNKLPYRFALWRFVKLCHGFPEIQSVYLRHSLVEGMWEPGLSDIDLTVIIRDGLEIEQEYHFLNFFWKAFGWQRRRLPMLSDVNILAARQIPFWTYYTIRGYEARHWKLIYGREIPRDSYIESPDKKMRDALNYAFTYYQWIFLPMFYKPAYKGYLAQRQLLRVANKIIRYGFQYQIDYMPNPKYCSDSMDAATMIACILKNLETCVKRSKLMETTDTSGFEPDLFPQWHEAYPVSDSQTNEFAQSHSILPFVECVYRETGQDYVVLKDALTLSELEHTVRTIITSRPAGLITPVIITLSVFEYILRYQSPDLYSSLRWKREIIWGNDVLVRIQAPVTDVFAEQQLANIINALTFVQSTALFEFPENTRSINENLTQTAMQLLRLKLYFEKGIVKIYKSQWLQECGRHFPEEYQKLVTVTEYQAGLDSDKDRLQSFTFLKRLANELCFLHSQFQEVNIENHLARRSRN